MKIIFLNYISGFFKRGINSLKKKKKKKKKKTTHCLSFISYQQYKKNLDLN